MRKGLQEGKLKFRIYGKKLHGSFALIRIRSFKGKASWLLIKQHNAANCGNSMIVWSRK